VAGQEAAEEQAVRGLEAEVRAVRELVAEAVEGLVGERAAGLAKGPHREDG